MNKLTAGNIIVMWDGKSFGTFLNLKNAIQETVNRICNPVNLFNPETDFRCLEFLEIVGEPTEPIVSYNFQSKDACNYRVSFGYAVIDHGNLLDELKNEQHNQQKKCN